LKSSLPKELIYADESENEKDYLKIIVKEILSKHNLKVNEDKTEETIDCGAV
jgi:hypothetical protein